MEAETRDLRTLARLRPGMYFEGHRIVAVAHQPDVIKIWLSNGYMQPFKRTDDWPKVKV